MTRWSISSIRSVEGAPPSGIIGSPPNSLRAISSQILEALRLPAPGAPPLRNPAVRGALADRDLEQDEDHLLGVVQLALAAQAVRVWRSSHQLAHGAPPGGVPGGTWIPRAAA